MVWDEAEGETLYKDAVKVFVTIKADSNIFKLGKPTRRDSVNYVIVHKALVLDSWIENGRTATYRETVERYKTMGKSKEEINALIAAGEDEDADKVFVMLEFNA